MYLYHFTATTRDTERYNVGEILTVRMVGFDEAAELPVVENIANGDQFTVQLHELQRVSEV